MKLNRKVPALVASLTFFIGFFNIASNILRRFRGPAEFVNDHFATYLNSAAFASVLFTGAILVILARGLRRKKLRAWQLTVLVLILNVFLEFFRFKIHPAQISLSIFLLVILFIYRNEFKAKSDPSTKFRPIFALIFSAGFFFLVGILLFYFRHNNNVIGKPSLSDVMLTVLYGWVWISGPVKLESEFLQNTIDITLGMFGIFVILIPLIAYLRRVSKVSTTSDVEKLEIKELIQKYGDEDSLAAFATREDKSFVWNQNKKAGIAYRIQNGVMVASGDPIGEHSLWPSAVEAFLNKANEYGWTPAVMGASEKGGRVWIEVAGLTAIEIGDEAIIDCQEFTLEGKPMANVRQTINRANREGFSAKTFLVKDLSAKKQNEIKDLAKNWRGNSIERGFSMSMDRFLGEIDQDSVLVLGYLNNELVGFLYFLSWGKVGFSLDRMQRAPKPLPGLTELMIENMITFCREKNYRYISLNFAAFRSVIERAEKISAGPILRTIRALIKLASGWFQVESLNRFNAKFQPNWHARYLLYPSLSEFAQVVWAILRAEKFISGFGARNKSGKGAK